LQPSLSKSNAATPAGHQFHLVKPAARGILQAEVQTGLPGDLLKPDLRHAGRGMAHTTIRKAQQYRMRDSVVRRTLRWQMQPVLVQPVLWGGPPGPRPTPPSASRTLQDADIVTSAEFAPGAAPVV